MKHRILLFLSMLALISGLATARTLSGTVVDDSNDEPLIGASVMVKGTTIGVVTDLDGNFSLDLPADAKTLQVSYVGFDPQEFTLSKVRENSLMVRMKSDNTLDEVVVTGMGTRKKLTLTGAVTTVDIEDLKHSSSSNLSNALAGNVPGIIAMQSSGQPGKKGTSEFWIRGISTFGAGDKAYIL
ncbi:MAG: carboxypeptidase-like regulatory domain-containing protein, partial [Muribaculaceae bacterium]|nr:carboxypeptidase-like regulatory domain-containing protein [Muribaculaceae bacterium]